MRNLPSSLVLMVVGALLVVGACSPDHESPDQIADAKRTALAEIRSLAETAAWKRNRADNRDATFADLADYQNSLKALDRAAAEAEALGIKPKQIRANVSMGNSKGEERFR